MKKVLISVFLIHLLIGNVSMVHSQNYVDIFSIGSAYSPNNSLKNSDDKVSISESFANLKLPIVLKNKDIILIGTNLSVLSFNKQIGLSNNNDFYTGSLQLGYTKQWSDKWNTLFMFIPKISSDFKDITSKDYQIGGILLFTFIKHENLKYKFGAYYNQEYFGPLIVPIVGIDWQPTEKLRLFGNLPINFTIDYKSGNKFSSGIYFQAPTMSYRLAEKYNNAYLQKTSQELSLYIDSYITENIVFTIKGGHSLGRSYRFYNENDKLTAKVSAFNIGGKRLPLNEGMNDGFIFEMKLSYRIPIKKGEK